MFDVTTLKTINVATPSPILITPAYSFPKGIVAQKLGDVITLIQMGRAIDTPRIIRNFIVILSVVY